MLPKTKHNKLGQRVNYKTQELRCYVGDQLRLTPFHHDEIVVRIGIRVSDKWQDFSPKALTSKLR